jgi:hypothetical protein
LKELNLKIFKEYREIVDLQFENGFPIIEVKRRREQEERIRKDEDRLQQEAFQIELDIDGATGNVQQ